MILQYLFSGVLVLVNYFLNLLPSCDTAILGKFTDFMNYLIPKFVTLGYYYLPMSSLLFYLKAYISLWLIVFGIKFTMKMVSVLTVGLVSTDKI